MKFKRMIGASTLALGLAVPFAAFSAGSASAHTHAVTPACDSLKVSLSSYDNSGKNTIKVTIDGATKADTTFGKDYSKTLATPTTGYDWKVVVVAHDNGHYSFSEYGHQDKCDNPCPKETVTQTVAVPGPTATVTVTAPGETKTETVTAPPVTFTETVTAPPVTETATVPPVTETAPPVTSTVTAPGTTGTVTNTVTATQTVPGKNTVQVVTVEKTVDKSTGKVISYKTVASKPSELAYTGVNGRVWLFIGAGLVIAGAALLWLSKPRLRRTH